MLDLCGELLVARGYKGGFCKKLLEASPISNRVNVRWTQNWPIPRPSVMVAAPTGEHV